MIQINDLSKGFGRQVIFDRITCTINHGERVGLVGRNGSGKSTLFRMIIGEEHPDSGNISLPQGYTIGHLSQHISFSQETVLKEACLSLRSSEDGIDETYKVKKVLAGLGFSEDDFEASPYSLSGGYQIRLNLAKVIVSEPSLLLLDEPTNYLDIISVRWLVNVLRSWKGELILITHDRDFMDSVTTHTMAIHRQKIRKIQGQTQKLYDQILLDEEVYEKTRINDDRKRRDIEQFINRFRAQANKAKAVQSRIKSLQKKERFEKLTDAKNLDFSFNAASFTGKQILSVENLSFGFDSDKLLINNLSFTIGKKERIAIIGKNGKGKTTLLNLLAGELALLAGVVSLHPAAKIAYFGQTNISRLNTGNTVEEEIMDVHPEHSRGAARRICGLMMFDGDSALKKISVLSGGEKSRVLLGKILVSPANLLLLDEPTNHLDMESIDSLIEAIEAFEGAVVIVTHSEMILHAVAEKLIVFDNNKVTVFDGTYQDFLDRIGWKDEASSDGVANQYSRTEKGINKRDARKLRSEIITNKSKVLNPIQKRMAEAERIIMDLEKKSEIDNSDLIKASMKGDGDRVRLLSKDIAEVNKKIETLFSELEQLTEELNIKTREFEEQLKDVS